LLELVELDGQVNTWLDIGNQTVQLRKLVSPHVFDVPDIGGKLVRHPVLDPDYLLLKLLEHRRINRLVPQQLILVL